MPDLDEISLMLGEMRADIRTVKDKVDNIEAKVEEVRDFKIKVVAYCTAASAGVTVLVSALKSYLSHMKDQ